MGKIAFTTRVLGTIAVDRLMQNQVTQTLRSESNGITAAIINFRVSVGDRLEVTLDGIIVGHAELLSIEAVTWDCLDIKDANRGGFDSFSDLKAALQRAGFRFQPLNEYHLFRIKFKWLESEPWNKRNPSIASEPGIERKPIGKSEP